MKIDFDDNDWKERLVDELREKFGDGVSFMVMVWTDNGMCCFGGDDADVETRPAYALMRALRLEINDLAIMADEDDPDAPRH